MRRGVRSTTCIGDGSVGGCRRFAATCSNRVSAFCFEPDRVADCSGGCDTCWMQMSSEIAALSERQSAG